MRILVGMRTTYCPDCHTHRRITDQHHEGEQTRQGETIYLVTELSCGHTTETTPRIYAPAPGAPYADPHNGVTHACSTRTRDLIAAVPTRDPWAGQ